MRITCILCSDKIPRQPNMMFVSIIKEAIKVANKDYYNDLYTYEDRSNKKVKPFTFSYYLDKYELNDNEIITNGNIVFNISTCDYKFGMNLYNGLLKSSSFNYKGYILERKKVSNIKEKDVTSTEEVFKTQSPICIKDLNGTFLKIDDVNFNDEFSYICNEIIKANLGRESIEHIQFEPVLMKKMVVKEDIRGYSGNKKFLYVNSYKGIFKLKGHRDDLNLLLKSGVGFRRSQGFGMIEKV
jgi:CRISPR-associated endoribonuclease Cas6